MSAEPGVRLPVLRWRRCKGIGTCVEVCPTGAIKMRGFRFGVLGLERPAMAYPEQCISCGRCVEVCPVRAWSL